MLHCADKGACIEEKRAEHCRYSVEFCWFPSFWDVFHFIIIKSLLKEPNDWLVNSFAGGSLHEVFQNNRHVRPVNLTAF